MKRTKRYKILVCAGIMWSGIYQAANMPGPSEDLGFLQEGAPLPEAFQEEGTSAQDPLVFQQMPDPAAIDSLALPPAIQDGTTDLATTPVPQETVPAVSPVPAATAPAAAPEAAPAAATIVPAIEEMREVSTPSASVAPQETAPASAALAPQPAVQQMPIVQETPAAISDQPAAPAASTPTPAQPEIVSSAAVQAETPTAIVSAPEEVPVAIVQPTEPAKQPEDAQEISAAQPTVQSAPAATPSALPEMQITDTVIEQQDIIPTADQEAVVIDEIEGIDTVNLAEPQGNWLFKRIWWERAEEKYEKVRKRVNEVLESRMTFLTQRSDLDKNILDPFYVEVGSEKGELQAILKELIAKLKSQREQGDMLSAYERELLDKAQTELAAVEQLHKDIEAIMQLDQNVDVAIAKMMEQINVVRQYEQEAWLKFKEIARVLSEKTARELFFQIDVISKNIQDIQLYLTGPFAQHFNHVVETAKQHIVHIQQSIALLKEKGIDLRQYLDNLHAPKDQQIVEVEEEEEEIVAPPKGFFGSIVDTVWGTVKRIGSAIVSVIRMPYDWIVGTKKPVVADDDEDDEE